MANPGFLTRLPNTVSKSRFRTPLHGAPYGSPVEAASNHGAARALAGKRSPCERRLRDIRAAFESAGVICPDAGATADGRSGARLAMKD